MRDIFRPLLSRYQVHIGSVWEVSQAVKVNAQHFRYVPHLGLPERSGIIVTTLRFREFYNLELFRSSPHLGNRRKCGQPLPRLLPADLEALHV